jgi:uncharacterized protein (TIRG00374 family)
MRLNRSEWVHFVFSAKGAAVFGALLLALIVALATLVDWPTVISMLLRADRRALMAAALSLLIGYLFYALRWRYLLNNLPSLSAIYHTANVGTMLNMLLPLRPGEPIRVLLLSSKGQPPLMMVTSSIVVERWMETVLRMAALGGALIYSAGAGVSGLTVVGSALYLIASFIFMIWLVRRRETALAILPGWLARLPRIDEPRARAWLEQLIDGLNGVSSLRRLLVALIYSVITWTSFWGFHFFALLALHPSLPTEQLLGISLGSLALVPPSATTLPGVFQVSMVPPLALMGYNASLLTTYSLALNSITFILVMALGLWGMLAAGLTLRQLVAQAEAAALK